MNATVGVANKEPRTCIYNMSAPLHTQYIAVVYRYNVFAHYLLGHTAQHCPGGVMGSGQLGRGHNTALQSTGSVVCTVQL